MSEEIIIFEEDAHPSTIIILQEISNKLSQIIHLLKDKKETPITSTIFQCQSNLPLKTIAELDSFEEYLREGNTTDFVCNIITIYNIIFIK